jgi:site-specific DNA-methyltransferase (adenine-specific)
MSTDTGNVVLDPFGESGTTFAVCEKTGRRWIGIEIESTDAIIERLENNELSHCRNEDFVER